MRALSIFAVLLLFVPTSAWIPCSSPSKTHFTKSFVSTVDDTNARSAFGTKEYWDDVYSGRGDFPAEEYSWYYGWELLGRHVKENIPSRDAHILIPGIGNDRLLLDFIQAGYKKITAQDYSEHAIERQQDLLHYTSGRFDVELSHGDVRALPQEWDEKFDAIVEKGLLDAVYLSGDGNLERALASLTKTLKPGGVFLSVSGVVPNVLRKEIFQEFIWLRDGSDDLQAGCFIFQKAIVRSCL